MFLCRYALFRIIITITVIAIIIIIVLPLREKRLLLLASTAAITTVPLVLIVVIIHRSQCTYCAVVIIPFYHRIVYLEIYLFCNNNTNGGVNKVTDMEKAHRLKFCILLQQAFTCKSISYYLLIYNSYVTSYENLCLYSLEM